MREKIVVKGRVHNFPYIDMIPAMKIKNIFTYSYSNTLSKKENPISCS